MVTMAFAQMVFCFFDNKVMGGSDGLYINFKPAPRFSVSCLRSGQQTGDVLFIAALLLTYAFYGAVQPLRTRAGGIQ
jgi:branched-chain amino acid transport system permease protein